MPGLEIIRVMNYLPKEAFEVDCYRSQLKEILYSKIKSKRWLKIELWVREKFYRLLSLIIPYPVKLKTNKAVTRFLRRFVFEGRVMRDLNMHEQKAIVALHNIDIGGMNPKEAGDNTMN